MNRLRPYLQLVRLPAVFTAFADIFLAWLATGVGFDRWLPLAFVLAASGCLYCGGMVWNDFFDVEQDRRERPFRPIPSGRVKRRTAGWMGVGFLSAGWFCAVASALLLGEGRWTPTVMATLLLGTILLYDSWLKRTWAGPFGMGACRFLNVLLGLTVAARFGWLSGAYLALVVCVYIIGVTWFARAEARTSSSVVLAGGAGVMLLGLLLALPLPVLPPISGGESLTSPLFPYLLVALGFFVGFPVVRAVARPAPKHVQAAVKRALMGLIGLDAVLATAVAGIAGLWILLLLAPVVIMTRLRWLYAT
jgi:4-hydroxybenzoate polyprenyltransferase